MHICTGDTETNEHHISDEDALGKMNYDLTFSGISAYLLTPLFIKSECRKGASFYTWLEFHLVSISVTEIYNQYIFNYALIEILIIGCQHHV